MNVGIHTYFYKNCDGVQKLPDTLQSKIKCRFCQHVSKSLEF